MNHAAPAPSQRSSRLRQGGVWGLVLLGALSVTACGGRGFPKPQLVAEPDPVVARLAAAADRAANALDTLASVENTRTPVEVPALAGDDAPIELRRAITVDWVGPVEPLARQLADRASYQFLTSGQAPSVPAIVTLRVRNTPLIDTLRDLGLQLNNRATLKVDPGSRTVEIIYGAIAPPPISATLMGVSGAQPETALMEMITPAAAMPVDNVYSQNLDNPMSVLDAPSSAPEATSDDNPLASPF